MLADGLPHRPGIYVFRGPSGEVLYVGTAVDLRRRVSQYFNGADPAAGSRKWSTWPPGWTTSSARTHWKPVCVSFECWPHMRPVQPPVEVSPPLVVGGS
ncbi:GIY-YIG catalytic domain protein [Mycobacterium kansasii]|uniref:GIY-YIG catalytic domain protein n=1 Tax=Mycobacterium kansasii TaxID=1768 RepID=A0A1V3WYJ6_MYCKA|nr:GIY-YIG catalytic domain protein [Mycobacterium kansasii]